MDPDSGYVAARSAAPCIELRVLVRTEKRERREPAPGIVDSLVERDPQAIEHELGGRRFKQVGTECKTPDEFRMVPEVQFDIGTRRTRAEFNKLHGHTGES